MDWSTVKRKLSSRKFWAAAAGLVSGIALAFGLDEGAASTISGAVVSLGSVAIYMLAESGVDRAQKR